MKPLQHARISAHRYGGAWRDWIAIHDWIDRSKMIFPSMQHRIFLHSDFGQWLAVRIFGECIEAEDGAAVPTSDVFRDHQGEALGRVVTLPEWLREIDAGYWNRRLRPPRHLEQVREEPACGLACRWGGTPGDYLALVGFFDKPRDFAPDSPQAAEMITHNSFGIFLAEDLFGTTITLAGASESSRSLQIVSTRSAAEDLVYARIGSIPPAGNLAARARLRPWMCGTEVGFALKARLKNERKATKRV